MLERFLREYPHDIPLRWFDGEMKPVFGIDVFESPFPGARGYRIWRRGRLSLLVLKLEMLDACGAAAFREFLDIEDFAVRHDNDASAKAHGTLYREFRSGLILPGEYLDRMYAARFSRHFYGDSEIAAFRGRWGAGIRL